MLVNTLVFGIAAISLASGHTGGAAVASVASVAFVVVQVMLLYIGACFAIPRLKWPKQRAAAISCLEVEHDSVTFPASWIPQPDLRPPASLL